MCAVHTLDDVSHPTGATYIRKTTYLLMETVLNLVLTCLGLNFIKYIMEYNCSVNNGQQCTFGPCIIHNTRGKTACKKVNPTSERDGTIIERRRNGTEEKHTNKTGFWKFSRKAACGVLWNNLRILGCIAATTERARYIRDPDALNRDGDGRITQ